MDEMWAMVWTWPERVCPPISSPNRAALDRSESPRMESRCERIPFVIDPAADDEVGEVGDVQCFAHGVKGEKLSLDGRRCQTGAVECHARADADAGGQIFGKEHFKLRQALVFAQPMHCRSALDDSSKDHSHGETPRRSGAVEGWIGSPGGQRKAAKHRHC